MDYPYKSVKINGREIFLSDILKGAVAWRDFFEETTGDFIRDWLNGVTEFMLNTSGSTGTPKPIVIQRNQMVASASATAHALGFRELDRALICLDTKYIAGKMMLVRCFQSGMHISAITPSANPLANLSGNTFHFAAFVPYQVLNIIRSDVSSSLNSCKKIIIGGAPVSQELIRDLQSFDSEIFATYGMTETISHVALRRLNGSDKTDYYQTLPNISIDVDERSCLIIQCDFLAEKILTNDIVEILNPTSFKWIGRADHVINSGGVKVSPEPIEAMIEPVIRALNLHARYIITSISDNLLYERLVLVLEGPEIGNEVKLGLRDELTKILNPYRVPKQILTLSGFPETASGKVNRPEIKKMVSKLL